jgi:hypothetical protein
MVIEFKIGIKNLNRFADDFQKLSKSTFSAAQEQKISVCELFMVVWNNFLFFFSCRHENRTQRQEKLSFYEGRSESSLDSHLCKRSVQL